MRSWAALGVALFTAALTSLLPLIPHAASTATAQITQPAYSGTLLYLNRGGIWQLNIATGQREAFLQLPTGTVAHVSHSWDHERIAYSTDVRGAGFELIESSIVIAQRDGSEPRTVVSEERTGATVEWPSWSPDGTRLAYSKTLFGYRTQRVEDVDLATGARTLVAEAGSSPTYAPDGESIVFASPFGQTWSISSAPRRGGDPSIIVPPEGFEDLDHPLYARNSEFIAFLGAVPAPEPARRPAPVDDPLAEPPFSVASAHPGSGADFDLWIVRPDGSGLRRVTELFSQQPYLTWSPDGRYLASRDRLGLRVIDMFGDLAAEGSVQWIAGALSSGPISWGR